MHHRWHGPHLYDIQFLAIRASTYVHRYSSLLQRSVPFGQWCHVTMGEGIVCTKYTLHSNHNLLAWYSNTQKDFYPGVAIFSLHILASPSDRNVNYSEKILSGERKLNCSFYLYRFRKYVSYGFPIINGCNPGVHYATPCIMFYFNSILYYLMTIYISTFTYLLISARNIPSAFVYHLLRMSK
jgi:hypothetical protein